MSLLSGHCDKRVVTDGPFLREADFLSPLVPPLKISSSHKLSSVSYRHLVNTSWQHVDGDGPFPARTITSLSVIVLFLVLISGGCQ